MARRSLPSLNGLKALEAFARHGRMTAAADELCVTHGAVSRQIRQLEEQLGVALVEGPRNRPRLTLAAAQLAASASQAFDLIERGMPSVEPTDEALRVFCIGTFAMKWLIPRLPNFYRDNPSAELRIRESVEWPDFAADDCDVAIRIAEAPYPNGMEGAAFLANHVGPVMAPALGGRRKLTTQQVLALPRLLTRTRMQAWQEWGNIKGVAVERPSASHLFEHNSYMLEAALAGLGVAMSPWPNVIQEVQNGRLVAPLGFVVKSGRHVMLQPRGRADPRAGLLARWLIDEGAATPEPPMC